MEIIQEVALRVKSAREAAGLTQSELAEALGLGANAISKIETGRAALRIEHLFELPKILERPISYFLGLQVEGLTLEEQELLALYRSLPTTGPLRRFAMAQVRSFVLVAQGAGVEEGDDELTE